MIVETVTLYDFIGIKRKCGYMNFKNVKVRDYVA